MSEPNHEISMEHSPTGKGLTRRDVVKNAPVLTIAGMVAPMSGILLGPDLSIEARYFRELIKTKQHLKDLYGLTPIIDIWEKGGHSVSVPKDKADKTLLVGEFPWFQISEEDPINVFPEKTKYGPSGIEFVSKESVSEERKKYQKSAIIGICDTRMSTRNFLDYMRDTQVLAQISGQITFFSSSIASEFVTSYLDRKLGYNKTLNKKRGFSRRSFLKLGVVGTGFILGTTAKSTASAVTREVFEAQPLTIDTSHLSSYEKEIVEIYNPFNRYIDTLRENSIHLNATALAAADFSRDLKQVQYSFANGHIRLLELPTKEVAEIENQTLKIIDEVVDQHIKIFIKYAKTSQAKEVWGAAMLSLFDFYQIFDPLWIRVNKQSGLDLEKIRSQIRPQGCARSPFLLLCEAIDNKLRHLEEYTDDPEIMQYLPGLITFALELLNDRVYQERIKYPPNKRFEVGLAGDKYNTDKVIVVGNVQASFSSGLVADIEKIN